MTLPRKWPSEFGAPITDASLFNETTDNVMASLAGIPHPMAISALRDLVGRGYTNVVDMVRDVGCDPTGATDDLARIQDAVDSHTGLTGGARLDWPSGVYKIDGPITLGQPIDWDAAIHFSGSGRRGVELRQFDGTQPIFDLRNATQNLRGVVISDMALKYGAQQLYLGKAEYNFFRNVTFWAGGEGGTKSHVLESGSHFNFFDNCWWVHGNPTGDCGGTSSGTAFYTNCQFGEDVGALYCGGEMWFVNCDFHYPNDRALTSGYQNMGKALITVPTDGILNINGSRIYVTNNFVNMDNASRVKICNNNITMGQGPVIKVRTTTPGYPLTFTDNNVTWQGNGSFYASTIAQHLQNSVITGNTFEVEPGFTVTIDDELLNPRYRNVWHSNTHRIGAVF